jgi:hypothetical protein
MLIKHENIQNKAVDFHANPFRELQIFKLNFFNFCVN